jgi:hypothetical protein
MKLCPGDHVCSLYDSEQQLAATAAGFLADGLARGERCWYVPSDGNVEGVRAAMERRGIDVRGESRRSALLLLDSDDTYTVRGGFDPEQTMRVFSEAIERALSDGFKGFRAAADMSWALTIDNGAESLIAYEALLRMLFSTSAATGLCLYDRRRMPLQVLNGALLTHPVVAVAGRFSRNDRYDASVARASDVDSSADLWRRRRTPSPAGRPAAQRRRRRQ